MFLRNVGVYMQVHTALEATGQTGRATFSFLYSLIRGGSCAVRRCEATPTQTAYLLKT
jgi:hypothetical protein